MDKEELIDMGWRRTVPLGAVAVGITIPKEFRDKWKIKRGDAVHLRYKRRFLILHFPDLRELEGQKVEESE